MLSLLRFAGLLLAVLAVAMVFALCGESVACAGCLEACCFRSGTTSERLHAVVSRVLEGLVPCAGTKHVPAVSVASRPLVLFGGPQLLEAGVVQLRI